MALTDIDGSNAAAAADDDDDDGDDGDGVCTTGVEAVSFPGEVRLLRH